MLNASVDRRLPGFQIRYPLLDMRQLALHAGNADTHKRHLLGKTVDLLLYRFYLLTQTVKRTLRYSVDAHDDGHKREHDGSYGSVFV